MLCLAEQLVFLHWAQIDPDSALGGFQFYKILITDGKSHRLCRPEVAVLRGACSSSFNSGLYFTDLYRPYNMKGCLRRPLTAMILHLSENLMGDLFVFRYISYFLSRNVRSILHR